MFGPLRMRSSHRTYKIFKKRLFLINYVDCSFNWSNEQKWWRGQLICVLNHRLMHLSLRPSTNCRWLDQCPNPQYFLPYSRRYHNCWLWRFLLLQLTLSPPVYYSVYVLLSLPSSFHWVPSKFSTSVFLPLTIMIRTRNNCGGRNTVFQFSEVTGFPKFCYKVRHTHYPSEYNFYIK